ncbi:hypothetical protein SCARD494_00356 [Seiridium cardinale]
MNSTHVGHTGHMNHTSHAGDAGHSGHTGHNHGGAPGACKTDMLWNWHTIDACFISSSWHVTSTAIFAGSCLGVFLLAVITVLARRLSHEYDAYLTRQIIDHSNFHEKDHTAPDHSQHPCLIQQLARSLLYVAQVALGYILMLLAMYYNGYIIISILAGFFVGFFASRKIKCDEAKPVCTRCTSTGRSFNGYFIPERKKHGFAKKRRERQIIQGSRSGGSLRLFRPIYTPLQGTDEERMLFYRYHTAATAGSGFLFRSKSHHMAFLTNFLPQIAHINEAVKQGLVALGAALQTMKLRNAGIAAIPEDIAENLVINQYSKSTRHLEQHTALLTFENLEFTLICCLTFIYLEITRANTDGSRIYVIKGLEIINKLVSERFFLYCSINDQDGRNRDLENTACRPGFNPSRFSRTECRHLLYFFCGARAGPIFI